MASNSQVDRLGDRLRTGQYTEDDLRELDAYRRSFVEAYETVTSAIRQELGLAPRGREAKSTEAILFKLQQRESIRLSQIQDIAGCRLVVEDIARQETVVAAIDQLFLTAKIVDRRLFPSNGYRAVHVIVTLNDRDVEVQVRTLLQHRWAELSETLSDRFGIDVKYGKGRADVVASLEWLSLAIALRERNDPDQPDSAFIDHQLNSLLKLL